MYNALLDKVHKAINTATKPSPAEEQKQFYNLMFAPEKYNEHLEKQRKMEDIATKLTLAATGLAVVGEVYHLAKRSDIINRISKR